MSFLKHPICDKELPLASFQIETRRFQKPSIIVLRHCMTALNAGESQHALLSLEHMWATQPSKFKTLCDRLNSYLKRSLQVRLSQSHRRKMSIPLGSGDK